jgi:1-acyl-sn-glycerol-3-phosphate acyltransferase
MLFLRLLIFSAILKPFAALVLGYSVQHRERLPKTGPAIVAANHNSHLDTLLLFVLFPARLLSKLRPVAAADYFLKGAASRWLSLNIVGILPIERRAHGHNDPLSGMREALERGEILFVFPEGTRGEPERMASLKSGIAHLAEDFPDVPIIPVFLQGSGRSLPKGSHLFVPYRCHGVVGERIHWRGERKALMTELSESFQSLSREVPNLEWEDDYPPNENVPRNDDAARSARNK